MLAAASNLHLAACMIAYACSAMGVVQLRTCSLGMGPVAHMPWYSYISSPIGCRQVLYVCQHEHYVGPYLMSEVSAVSAVYMLKLINY